MAGWCLNENKVARRKRRETLTRGNDFKSQSLLHGSAFYASILTTIDAHKRWPAHSPCLQRIFQTDRNSRSTGIAMRDEWRCCLKSFQLYENPMAGTVGLWLFLWHRRLRCSGWHGKVTKGSAGDDTQRWKRLCSAWIVSWPLRYGYVGTWGTTIVLSLGGMFSVPCQLSPQPSPMSTMHFLPWYYDRFPHQERFRAPHLCLSSARTCFVIP